jgi:hypothetical protein
LVGFEKPTVSRQNPIQNSLFGKSLNSLSVMGDAAEKKRAYLADEIVFRVGCQVL